MNEAIRRILLLTDDACKLLILQEPALAELQNRELLGKFRSPVDYFAQCSTF
jgi:hypothetical protein